MKHFNPLHPASTGAYTFTTRNSDEDVAMTYADEFDTDMQERDEFIDKYRALLATDGPDAAHDYACTFVMSLFVGEAHKVIADMHFAFRIALPRAT